MIRQFYAFILVLFIVMVSCDTVQSPKSLWPHGVKYEVFVLAFADGNNDGKGDLKGLTEKLDYVQQLGANGIWLMPIMPSPSYHKYDVTDYKNIHPDYGTLDDFKLFVAEAHKRDIHVVVDLVLNHTSKEHPWFKSACEEKQSPYRDYFVWADKDSIKDQIAKKTITLDSDNITQWHAVNGDETAEHYYGFFSSHMPDLNFDNQKVRDEMVDVARFWIEEMNVDGFRFDAAKHIYPDDRAADNHEFWKWYREQLQEIKPDIYLVGEVYSVDQHDVAPYTNGLPALFNFEMGSTIISVLNEGKDTIGLVNRYLQQSQFFKSVNNEFLDAPILTNHDQNRIMSQLQNDHGKAKVAASILLTLPGTPYVYYGEELGMQGVKPDEFIREPFPWGDSFTTKWMEPRFNTKDSLPDFKAQQSDISSLYHHYQKLIAYRNASKPLTCGSAEAILNVPATIIALKRSTEGEEVAVFHNISSETIEFDLPEAALLFKQVAFTSNDNNSIVDNRLRLSPYTTLILKK